MASHVITASVIGLDAHLVDVEADISPGLGHVAVVGLPDTAVQEAKERVRSAMKHAELEFPRTRVTVNLAPADLKKIGTPFDLPIALAIAAVDGQIRDTCLERRLFVGELGLDGALRPVHGVLSIAMLAKERGMRELIVPKGNASEAALVNGLRIIAAARLEEVVGHISGRHEITSEDTRLIETSEEHGHPDFSAIRGQEQARRALEIAAAGGHNVLMQGPPGSGKTLLARSFPSILPRMTADEALETTRIYSIAGLLPAEGMIRSRPFRSPHHSASAISLVGGGAFPKPGEISLAHRGVLFLDEFLEFPRTVLESLRQPLEDGRVTVSRAQGTMCFPAQFALLGAMNPCPCGFLTDPDRACTCSALHIARYRKRLSGPLLDRIDLCIEVAKVPTKDLTDIADGEPSAAVRARVQAARDRQTVRLAPHGLRTNAELTSHLARKLIKPTPEAADILRHAVDRHKLSARAYFRLLKVAQTIADLAGIERVEGIHVAEALQYRLEPI